MMERISQRNQSDCSVCVLAMVMGPPHSYERVLGDSKKYAQTDQEGHGLAWWKQYLQDEGFRVEHRRLSDVKWFTDLASLPQNCRAMLVFKIPQMGIGHIVAIDEHGVIDPQDDPAEYRGVREFCEIFKIEGWQLYSAHYWLVCKDAEETDEHSFFEKRKGER